MEYVYAALVLHELGEKITEKKITDILQAAGASVDASRVKALVAALGDVDIEEALKTAVMAAAPAAGATASAASGGQEAKEEKKEEEEEEEEDTDLGLGALFG